MIGLQRNILLNAIKLTTGRRQWSPLSTQQAYRCLWQSRKRITTTSNNTAADNSNFSTNSTNRQRTMFNFGLSNNVVRSTPPTRRKRPVVQRHEPKQPGQLYPLSAIHIAQTIDLVPLFSTVFSRNILRKQMFGKNSIVVQLAPVTPHEPPRFVTVFRFGSVVFVNVSPKEVGSIVSDVQKHAREPVLSGFERKEHFAILVDPDVASDYDRDRTIVTGDYCIVPELDMNGVAVISNIMGQTVALDTYSDTVDDLLANFALINTTVSKTGSFTSTDRTFLFQTVAQNNSIFIDMISKIRIKDRSETAWTLTKFERIHYGLKDEFEIDDRFDHIEFKLNLIQQNAKFFLEVLQHQKSNSLEWIIVVLIAVECVIMCLDMTGLGEPLLADFIKLMD